MRTITLFAMLLLALTSVSQAQQTYAERLGWNAGDRVLIIHCDDAGMSYASNQGASEALEFGLVTSASIMMPCSWVPGFAAWLKKHPGTDAGVHLTLTSEYDYYRWMPVAGAAAVPGLVDAQGCLHDNVGMVVQKATPDELEREIRAQVDRALGMGIDVTHLDSHMGTVFATPEFFERYAKVGIEKGIPILIMGSIQGTGLDQGMAQPVRAAAEKVWAAGLPVIDFVHTDSYDWRTTDKLPHFAEAVRAIKPGITEMIIHCTKPDDVIEVINGGRTHLYGDYTAMINPELKKVIEDEGIILTTWRELKARRQKAGK